MDGTGKDRNEKRFPAARKHMWWWILGLSLLMILFLWMGKMRNVRVKEVSRSTFDMFVDEGRIAEVVVTDSYVKARFDPAEKPLRYERYDAVVTSISREEVPEIMVMLRKARNDGLLREYTYRQANQLFVQLLVQIVPWVVVLFVVWYIFFKPIRTPSGGGPGVFAFGSSRARRIRKEDVDVTFDDVAGMEEAKEEVKELVEFLKHPYKFRTVGGRIPRGVLLVGPPGTGKTLLAKAIAGEAEVPFYSISGSDFVEMFVGVGAARVRDLFQRAREDAPSIIFLDEIDAVGRKRGSGWGGGHDEREQTLNAMLVEMDGFNSDDKVIVIAATNRPDVLDPALLRPGRFDREIYIDLPDLREREEILRIHARKVRLAPDVDLQVIARSTASFSGADLEAVINEAAILAVMRGKTEIGMEELEESRDKVFWGRQRRSRKMDEEDKRITAYHEAGHALVAKLLPEVEPLHKVTIIPRGMSLGATMQIPEKERYHMTRTQLLGNIKVLLAGRISEEMFCNDVSTGGAHDLSRATSLAQRMVCVWGMSDKLGPLSYAELEGVTMEDGVFKRKSDFSEATAILIDREIKRIIDKCYEDTRRLLEERKDDVDKIARALMKHETLEARHVDELLAGKEPEDLDIEPPKSNEEIRREMERKRRLERRKRLERELRDLFEDMTDEEIQKEIEEAERLGFIEKVDDDEEEKDSSDGEPEDKRK